RYPREGMRCEVFLSASWNNRKSANSLRRVARKMAGAEGLLKASRPGRRGGGGGDPRPPSPWGLRGYLGRLRKAIAARHTRGGLTPTVCSACGIETRGRGGTTTECSRVRDLHEVPAGADPERLGVGGGPDGADVAADLDGGAGYPARAAWPKGA